MTKQFLHICHSLNFGGITTFVKSLVNLNTDHNANHHILVWQKEAKGDFVTDISKSENQIQEFNQIIDDYDLIFVHSLKLSFLSSLLKRKKRVYLFQHGMTFGSGLRKLYKLCVYFLIVNVFQFKIICSSEFAKKKLKSQILIFNEDLIKIIPFGIDLEHTSQRSKTEHKINIGFAGRLVAQKRIHRLLDSVSKLECEAQVCLQIAGTGQLLNDLKEKAEHLKNSDLEIKFLGHLENMSDFYANIDIFVLPSIGESYGLVVLEAFHHNVPVIVFEDTGACVDFIIPNENGFVVNTTTELSKQLCNLSSIDIRHQLKGKLKDMDLSKYSISNTKLLLDEL